jgi:hypothetical protein
MREFKCLWKKFEAQNDSSGGVKIRPQGMRRHQMMTLFLVIPRLLHYEESKTVPMYETTVADLGFGTALEPTRIRSRGITLQPGKFRIPCKNARARKPN